MKNFVKKIAFVLALAMVLTNIAPAFTAQAAELPSLKYKSKVIYVNGSTDGKYNDYCWTPSQNTKGYEVSYEVTKGANLVEVTSNGKITATGKGNGLAVVKVSYEKDGEKTITANFSVKVRRNATAVRLTNAVAAELDKPLAVNQEIVLKGAKSATTPASYAKGNYGLDNYRGVVTDQIDYRTSDKDVITVSKNADGKYALKAVGAGTATLTIFTYQYLDDSKKEVLARDYEVTVAGGIVDVKQVTPSQVEVTLGKEVTKAEVKDLVFAISKVSNNMKQAIDGEPTLKKNNGIAVDSGNVVVLNTYTYMNDGADYKVAFEDGEVVFTATDNKVTAITLAKPVDGTISYDTLTEVSANLVDKNGVILDTVNNDTTVNNVTFTLDAGNDGYVYGKELYLYNKGGKATLTVTYHSNVYESGKEVGNIELVHKFVAGEKRSEIPAGAVKYTIVGNPGVNVDPKKYDWDALTTPVTTIAVGTNKTLRVYLPGTDGVDEIDLTQKYILSVADNSTDILGMDDKNDSEKGVYAKIYAYKTGTAQIHIKDLNDKIITSFPISVKAEREVKSFNLASSVVVSNAAVGDTSVSNVNVDIDFFDQYGDKYNDDWFVDIEEVKKPSNGGSILAAGEDKVIVSPENAEVGQYVYKLTINGVSRNITVNVKEPSGTTTYKLIFSDTELDLKYNASDVANQNKTVSVKVGEYKGGLLNAVSTDILTGTDDVKVFYNGTNVADTATTLNATPKKIPMAVTNSEVTLTVKELGTASGSAIVKAQTGTYNVSVKTADRTLTGSFTLKDGQVPLTTVEYTDGLTNGTVSASSVEAALKAAIKTVKYGYTDSTNYALASDFTVVSHEKNNSTITNNNYAIKTITVEFKPAGLDVPVRFTISVNKTFKLNINQ